MGLRVFSEILHTALTKTEHEAKFEFTKDTPYLTLMGELWAVHCEYLGES